MKLKSFLFFTLLFLFLFSNTDKGQAATTLVSPINPVKVELAKDTTSITTNGFYQIKNLSTGEVLLLKNSLPISFSRSGTLLTAKFGYYTFNSSLGFELNEVTGPSKYVTFSTTKGAKRSASTSEPDQVVYQNGEAAEYLSTYISGSQTWYLIAAKNGNNLAVLADSNTTIVDKPVPQTVTVNSITSKYSKFRGNLKYSLSSTSTPYPQLINVVGMQDYLKGVVPNEMSASWNKQALKAQAVAARSYAYVKSQKGVLSKTTSSQVYNGYVSEDSRSNAAVDETNELYVKYNNRVIETFFSSTSGGQTANVGDVWNSNQTSFPYLVSREDKYENSPYSNWTYNFSASQILTSFGLSNSSLYDISLSNNKVNGTGTTQNGEVSGVTIQTSSGTKTLTGNEQYIRKLFPVTTTYGMLPSNWFTISATKQYKVQLNNQSVDQFNIKGNIVQLANSQVTINTTQASLNNSTQVIAVDTDPATIVVTGKGWGHRIGMSQYGAKGYAENGWDFQQILKHYYYGTTISGL